MLTNMRPVDEREFSRVLAEATATATPVEVAGNGSKKNIGRPISCAAHLSTKGLRGITLYEPSEMVMSARAATPLTQIEEALAERHQMLPGGDEWSMSSTRRLTRPRWQFVCLCIARSSPIARSPRR